MWKSCFGARGDVEAETLIQSLPSVFEQLWSKDLFEIDEGWRSLDRLYDWLRIEKPWWYGIEPSEWEIFETLRDGLNAPLNRTRADNPYPMPDNC